MIAIGDIESFFNENFFKKVPAQERKIDHRHNAEEIKFNGVPESQYEPYYNTYIPYNSTQPRFEETPIPSNPIFTKKHGLSSEIEKESKSFTSRITDSQTAFMKNRQRLEKTPISSKPIFTKKHGLNSELDQDTKSFTSGITDTQRAFMKNNILDQHDNKVCYIELFIIIRHPKFYSKHKHSKLCI